MKEVVPFIVLSQNCLKLLQKSSINYKYLDYEVFYLVLLPIN